MIRNRVQHDIYHVYTVDTHSIFAVNELSLLLHDERYQKDFKSYFEAVGECLRPELLSLGLLFHDIGKGQGGNHSVIGAKMARTIMQRFGFSEHDIEVVEFLVLSHLLMPYLSQRRDLEDYNMLTEFARSMGSLERLNMLYVLTWADIRAVSAEAWTEWKGHLLQTLYQRTSDLITNNQTSEEFVKKRVSTVRQAILNRMKDRVDGSKLEAFLDSISPRYIVAHSDDEVFQHFSLITNHDDKNMLFVESSEPHETLSEVLLYTWNNPRLIPLVTGVMLSLDVNILQLESFVLKDGHVFLKMGLQSQGRSLKRSGIFETIRETLSAVFTGEKNVDELILKRKKPSYLNKDPIRKQEAVVNIDNDVSAYYTVIDIFTHDRLGLLYDVITCLVEQGCYVEVSKISTKVDQVVDTFYVKDIFGHKFLSKSKINEIKSALLKILDPQSHDIADERKKGIAS